MKIVATPMLLAAASLIAATPAAAAPANPAARLSLAPTVRAGTATAHRDRLAGGAGVYALGLVGLIVVVAGVLIATNDTPTSV